MPSIAHTSAELKSRPNHQEYLRVLQKLGPVGRLCKALELGEEARALFRAGLRQTFPHLTEPELKRLYLERLAKCHNTNSLTTTGIVAGQSDD